VLKFIKNFSKNEFPRFGALDILKYIGPGFLVTVGFIDPGNWAANMAAGSEFGYRILWVVTLSTAMLIFLQHNAAHLGIATGLCLSEASTAHFRPAVSRVFLASAMAAAVSTALAELLGSAIGLQMLFGLPLPVGATLTAAVAVYLLFSNNYRRIEKYIIGFVSLIGASFIFELSLIHISWGEAARGWVVPAFPAGSMPIIMSVLGAVVMPHNIYLHSEIIQSRQWNKENEAIIVKQLRYEMADTVFAMLVGWAINSAMILVAASLFNRGGITVTDLPQAQRTLEPLLGGAASVVFAVALVFAGLSSSLTAGMSGGSIFAGIFGEPFNVTDKHSRVGMFITLAGGLAIVFFLGNPYRGLIWSQVVLSIQLPWTIFGLISLTSSRRVMGKYRNGRTDMILLVSVAVIVSLLNVLLLIDMFQLVKI
jgi:manganese transport protein